MSISQLRRTNITVIALFLFGYLNMALAVIRHWGEHHSAAGMSGWQVLRLEWLATPIDRALFAIGVLMVIVASGWTVLDLRHDRRLLDSVETTRRSNG